MSSDRDKEMSRRDFLKKVSSTGAAILTIPVAGDLKKSETATEKIRNSKIYNPDLAKRSKKKAAEHIHRKNSVSLKETKKGKKTPVRFHAEIDNPREFGEKWFLANEKCAAIVLEAENESNQKYVTQLTTVIPSGWTFYGFINVSSAGGGISTYVTELNPGEKTETVAFVFKSGDHSDEVELLSTYFPEGKKDSAQKTEASLHL